jgi:hypothetical protein
MAQLTLLRSMLTLVEHRLALTEDAQGARPIGGGAGLGVELEPDAPEALFLAYIESLALPELMTFRTEICVAAMRQIDDYYAALETG